MEIKLNQIKVRNVVENYTDDAEEGVYGLNGKLNIRPKYQREFVYKDKQRDAVIDTLIKNLPLNVMYWVDNEDGTYEVLDGQQRTISICQYVNGAFSINEKYFHNLTDVEQDAILDYELMVYICKGNDKEKLEWFRTINISGEKLTEQELLNINYVGTWLSDAKKMFSKSNCVAYQLAEKFVKGSPIRQEFLETAIDWISDGKIAEYMAIHQHDINANELWLHFNNVITWAKLVFPKWRKEMKGLNWGKLYDTYKNNTYDSNVLEKKVAELMADDDVTKKSGIYEYLLSNGKLERCLSIRAFSDTMKRTVYEKQSGICPICGEKYEISEMDGDHVVEWSRGGKTTIDNLQMVCHNCHKKLTKTMF